MSFTCLKHPPIVVYSVFKYAKSRIKKGKSRVFATCTARILYSAKNAQCLRNARYGACVQLLQSKAFLRCQENW